MPDDSASDPSSSDDSAHEEASRTLETALVALQKTFSRVSGRSYDVPPDQPRALIVGDVTFELRTRVNKAADDRLLLAEDGAIELTLNGTVRTDVRENVPEDSASENDTPNPT